MHMLNHYLLILVIHLAEALDSKSPYDVLSPFSSMKCRFSKDEKVKKEIVIKTPYFLTCYYLPVNYETHSQLELMT